MKVFHFFLALPLLSLFSPVFAEDVTPAMEDAFLNQFKMAIANKDYKQFRELCYESENKGEWMKLQATVPFDTIFSDSKRVYSFEPPWTGWSRDMQTTHPTTWYGIPSVLPIFSDKKWYENLHVARELIITFPMKVPHTFWNYVHIPLIVKDGKLFAVREYFIMN
jgi:hypothetical protein